MKIRATATWLTIPILAFSAIACGASNEPPTEAASSQPTTAEVTRSELQAEGIAVPDTVDIDLTARATCDVWDRTTVTINEVPALIDAAAETYGVSPMQGAIFLRTLTAKYCPEYVDVLDIVTHEALYFRGIDAPW